MNEMMRPDPTDDRLRALARAARTEVEAGLDADAELTAVRERAATFSPEKPSTHRLHPAPRNRMLVVLGTAAAAVLIVGAAIWIGSTDDTITTTAATTLPPSLPATTAPIPATTPLSTTPPTDPPSTTTTTTAPSAPEAVIPPGSIDLGPDDLIARAVDGDVWWYPGALGDAPADRILLIDRDDPRQVPDEGEGPNIIDHVAGAFEGSLIYSDCCEPVSGNLLAITEPGAEADLWSSPSGVSRTALLWGVGWEPRFEPGGTRVLASNWDVAQVTNLATGAADFLPLYDAGELGGLGAVWAANSIAVLGWSFDEGLVLSVRDADTMASEIDRVVLAPPADKVPAAGITGTTETSVVVFVRDDAGLARFITIETGSWTVADELLGFDVPADASEMHLGADGNLMTWVVDGVGWAQRRGAAAVRIDDGLAEMWIPETSGSAVRPIDDPATGSTDAAGAPIDWRDLPWEMTALGAPCGDGEIRCVQLDHAVDGTPITYEFGTNVLIRHSTPPVVATLPPTYGDLASIVATGPDEVVYLRVDPAVRSEEARDIVAVTLTDSDAGREVGRWDRVAPSTTFLTFEPTADGLVATERLDRLMPSPDAPVLVPWLDRSGRTVRAIDLPTLQIENSAPTMTVRRSDAGSTRTWSFEPVGTWLPEVSIPRITPTFDGGFIALIEGADGTAVTRGYADGEVDQVLLDRSRLFGGVEAVDPAGRVVVTTEDGTFARVDPFADRTVRPVGQASVDVEAGTVTLPDLSAVTAEWLRDPVAFADAVSGPLVVNEQRTITAEQRSDTEWLVTVTTSNFFDDSVFGVRWELTLERADDGRFSFVSGRWSNVCQPNRGHQDFQPVFCV